jgi:nucleotide-binding universal stress UspA family protein
VILRSVIHPTDFSELNNRAFAHALRIALAARCDLDLLHVADSETDYREMTLPRVQRILTQWGALAEGEPSSAIAAKLGMHVNNVRLERQVPSAAIIEFLKQKGGDLIVFATHGRDGIGRWLMGSIAETVFGHSAIPTLFVAPGARGFVSEISGNLQLRRALLPVDRSPAPDHAITTARLFARLLTGRDIAIDLLHVGSSRPNLSGSGGTAAGSMMLRSGNVVQTIIDAAVEFEADLICMATSGRHGIFDALRGSTTERVLRHAPCPLLAVAAG